MSVGPDEGLFEWLGQRADESTTTVELDDHEADETELPIGVCTEIDQQ